MKSGPTSIAKPTHHFFLGMKVMLNLSDQQVEELEPDSRCGFPRIGKDSFRNPEEVIKHFNKHSNISDLFAFRNIEEVQHFLNKNVYTWMFSPEEHAVIYILQMTCDEEYYSTHIRPHGKSLILMKGAPITLDQLEFAIWQDRSYEHNVIFSRKKPDPSKIAPHELVIYINPPPGASENEEFIKETGKGIATNYALINGGQIAVMVKDENFYVFKEEDYCRHPAYFYSDVHTLSKTEIDLYRVCGNIESHKISIKFLILSELYSLIRHDEVSVSLTNMLKTNYRYCHRKHLYWDLVGMACYEGLIDEMGQAQLAPPPLILDASSSPELNDSSILNEAFIKERLSQLQTQIENKDHFLLQEIEDQLLMQFDLLKSDFSSIANRKFQRECRNFLNQILIMALLKSTDLFPTPPSLLAAVISSQIQQCKNKHSFLGSLRKLCENYLLGQYPNYTTIYLDYIFSSHKKITLDSNQSYRRLIDPAQADTLVMNLCTSLIFNQDKTPHYEANCREALSILVNANLLLNPFLNEALQNAIQDDTDSLANFVDYLITSFSENEVPSCLLFARNYFHHVQALREEVQQTDSLVCLINSYQNHFCGFFPADLASALANKLTKYDAKLDGFLTENEIAVWGRVFIPEISGLEVRLDFQIFLLLHALLDYLPPIQRIEIENFCLAYVENYYAGSNKSGSSTTTTSTLPTQYFHLVRSNKIDFDKIKNLIENRQLQKAILAKDFEKANTLLRENPRLSTNQDDYFAIKLAALRKELPIIKYLVEEVSESHRVDPSFNDNFLLRMAVSYHYSEEITKFLLGKINLSNLLLPRGTTLFAMALRTNDLSVLKLFIENGLCFDNSDLDHSDLIKAVDAGNLEYVKYVAIYGIDLYSPQKVPLIEHALIRAARLGYLSIFQFLSAPEKFSDITILPFQYELALCTAATYGHLTIIKFLIDEMKIEPSVNGNRSILAAMENNHPEVVEYLLDMDGVDPSASDYKALISCCEQGHAEILKLVMEKIPISSGLCIGGLSLHFYAEEKKQAAALAVLLAYSPPSNSVSLYLVDRFSTLINENLFNKYKLFFLLRPRLINHHSNAGWFYTNKKKKATEEKFYGFPQEIVDNIGLSFFQCMGFTPEKDNRKLSYFIPQIEHTKSADELIVHVKFKTRKEARNFLYELVKGRHYIKPINSHVIHYDQHQNYYIVNLPVQEGYVANKYDNTRSELSQFKLQALAFLKIEKEYNPYNNEPQKAAPGSKLALIINIEKYVFTEPDPKKIKKEGKDISALKMADDQEGETIEPFTVDDYELLTDGSLGAYVGECEEALQAINHLRPLNQAMSWLGL